MGAIGSESDTMESPETAALRVIDLGAVARWAGGVMIVAGALALVGWMFEIEVLKSVIPGSVSMKPNAALAFIACGAGLWSSAAKASQKWHVFSTIFSSLAIAIGGLVVLEYASGRDFGIDQALFREPAGAIDTYAPARMAPASAVSFVFVGMALLLGRRREWQKFAAALMGIVGWLALLGAAAYFYDSDRPAGLAASTRMALPTAVSFLVASGGVLAWLAKLRGSSSEWFLRSRVLIGLLPAVVVVPLILGWLRLQGERAGLFSASFGVALMVASTASLLALVVWWNARGLFRADANRRDAERALRESEQHTRLIIEAAYDSFIAMDARGIVLDWNPQAEKTFGFTRSEALGRALSELIIPERYREAHRAGLQRFLSTGEARVIGRPIEITALNRLREEFPVELSISAVKWGETWVFNAFIHDITERKQKDALEVASAAKDHFIAVLSHELRTPLTPVLATIMDLDSYADLSPPVREAIQLIQRNVELEARLIDDLLDVTRLSKGKLRIEQNVVNLASVLRSAMEVCQSELLKKQVRIGLDLQAPNHTITGDAPRLIQVFWNLLQNAVKFTPVGGEITIRTRAENVGELEVQIQDSGIGMSPEVLKRIFKPFEQADQSISRRFGGLGLGLALARALVEAHGGNIEATSPGADLGTVVTVTVPTISEPRELAEIVIASPLRRAMPLRILLVEDHADTRATLMRLLTRWGHTVFAAENLAQGRQLLAQNKFDLLLSDLGLPDGSGTELMREIRQSSSIPGIALSGFGTESDSASSLEAGFAAHFTKPVGTQYLKAAIDQIARETA